LKRSAERVLLIDDEPQITRVIRSILQINGFDVRAANDSEEGIRLFNEWTPDLVITDLLMQDLNGIEICRAIRASSAVPVLVLSIRDQEADKVEAFDAGADDYITKPFSTPELIARIRAHLRRAPQRASDVIARGDFVIDPTFYSAKVLGSSLRLTPKEFDLLLHLTRNAGRMTTHRSLLIAVWGQESACQQEYLRVFIGQLRKKLAAISGKCYIETEPWIGYRLVPEGIQNE